MPAPDTRSLARLVCVVLAMSLSGCLEKEIDKRWPPVDRSSQIAAATRDSAADLARIGAPDLFASVSTSDVRSAILAQLDAVQGKVSPDVSAVGPRGSSGTAAPRGVDEVRRPLR